MTKLAGRATVRVNGQTFKQEKGATFDPGGTKRTTKVASGGVAGFAEETVPSKLEVSVFIFEGFSVAQIRTWDDVTLSFELDTGQTYVVNHAWATDPPPIEESDGKAKIVIEGPPAEEVL